MMTVVEVAKRLGVSKGLIYKLVNSGKMASYRVGGTIRISEKQVQDYLERPPEEDGAKQFRHLRL